MAKYKFTDNRVINLNFNEEVFNKNIKEESELKVEVSSNILIGNEPNDVNFLIRMKFHISDGESGKFKLNLEIISRFTLELDENEELKNILNSICIPDILGKSRKMIKKITTEMNIQPVDLPPFNEELNNNE